jgi:hypothetical protein
MVLEFSDLQKQQLIDFYNMSRKSTLEYSHRLYPYVLIIGILLGGLLALSLGGSSLLVEGMKIAGLPVIFSAVIIFYYNSNITAEKSVSRGSLPVRKTFVLLYVLVAVYSYIIPSRNWVYFVAVGVLYTLTLYYVLYTKEPRSSVVVLKSSFLLLLVSLSLSLQQPLYYANTDIIPHLYASVHVYDTGTIIPESTSNYEYFPLYHILFGTYLLIAGNAEYEMYFILSGFAFALSPYLIYLFVSTVTDNDRLVSSSIIIYSTLPVVIYYSAYVITRTFAFFGFVLILYLLFRMMGRNEFRLRILFVIISLYTLLVHQVSYIQIIVLLMILLGINYLIQGRSSFSFLELMVFSLPFIAYWTLIAEELFQSILFRQILGMGLEDTTSNVEPSITTFHILEYINNHIYVSLIFFGISIALIANREDLRVAGVFGLLTSIFMMYGPQNVINRLAVFRLDRLMLLLAPFAALLIAISIYRLSLLSRAQKQVNKGVPVGKVIIIFAFFVFATTSLTGGIYHDAAADSPDIDWANPPEHFTESELNGFDHLKNVPTDTEVYSDREAEKYMYSVTLLPDREHNHRVIYETNNLPDSMMIVRTERKNTDGVYFGGSRSTYLYDGPLPVNDRSVIYNNGGVQYVD